MIPCSPMTITIRRAQPTPTPTPRCPVPACPHFLDLNRNARYHALCPYHRAHSARRSPPLPEHACPIPGCVRKRELRRRRPDGSLVLRATCQAHRNAPIPEGVILSPPPTPWRPVPTPTAERHHRLDTPFVSITTVGDGTWDLTEQDVRTLALANHTGVSAFAVVTNGLLSRKMPTAVIDRVWGMLDRGDLTVDDLPAEKRKGEER